MARPLAAKKSIIWANILQLVKETKKHLNFDWALKIIFVNLLLHVSNDQDILNFSQLKRQIILFYFDLNI